MARTVFLLSASRFSFYFRMYCNIFPFFIYFSKLQFLFVRSIIIIFIHYFCIFIHFADFPIKIFPSSAILPGNDNGIRSPFSRQKSCFRQSKSREHLLPASLFNQFSFSMRTGLRPYLPVWIIPWISEVRLRCNNLRQYHGYRQHPVPECRMHRPCPSAHRILHSLRSALPS